MISAPEVAAEWLLTAEERGNPATTIDATHRPCADLSQRTTVLVANLTRGPDGRWDRAGRECTWGRPRSRCR